MFPFASFITPTSSRSIFFFCVWYPVYRLFPFFGFQLIVPLSLHLTSHFASLFASLYLALSFSSLVFCHFLAPPPSSSFLDLHNFFTPTTGFSTFGLPPFLRFTTFAIPLLHLQFGYLYLGLCCPLSPDVCNISSLYIHYQKYMLFCTRFSGYDFTDFHSLPVSFHYHHIIYMRRLALSVDVCYDVFCRKNS